MKIVVATAAVTLAALILAEPAAAKPDRNEIEIRDAVARVVVIVEDRADVAVEIEQGASGLPPIRVQREGGGIEIDGGLARRVGGLSLGDRLRNCRAGPDDARQPGVGSSVEVGDLGRINLTDAPLIVIRTPPAVRVSAYGAVFGAVGRGASSISLGNGGCGTWTVANTTGAMDLSVGGSGAIRAGTSQTLDASVGGSGSITAGATGALEVAVGGSGNVTVARVEGPTEIAIGGSGDVAVRAGSASDLSISIGGSGDVDFGGVAGDVSVSIAGSGDVRIARATGSVSRTVVGSGDIQIGR